MKKNNLLKTLTRNTIVLFTIFTILFILLYSFTTYIKYISDSNTLREEHIQAVKNTLKWEVEHYINLIKTTEKSFKKTKKTILKTRVTKVHDMALALYNASNKDKNSIDKLKKTIITALRKIRFPNNGYYFILNTDGVEILYDLNKELEGKNLLHNKNEQGVFVIKEMIDLVKKDKEGLYTYTWEKPNLKTSKTKTAYIKLFEPLGWIIGTGVYKDDVDKAIQDEIISNIEQMKLNQENDNYIFMTTWEGISLTYPVKGKNMYMIQDKNGKYIVQELIKTSKNGGGFVEYIMPNLENEKSSKKISYVKGVPEWSSYVGAGLYIDDINAQIKALETKMYHELINTLILAVILALFTLTIFSLFYKKINQNFKEDYSIFINFFNSLVNDSKKIDLKNIKFKEFEEMAIHANIMLEQKKALEEDLEKYKLIVSISGDFLSLVDKNYIYQAANDTYLKYFSKSREQIIGHSARELFGEEVFKTQIKHLNDRALSGECFSQEIWLDFPIGKTCLQAQYYPYVKKGEKEAEFFVIAARDITADKLINEKLRLWQKVFENTSEAVMICDTTTHIMHVNKSFCRITGYTEQEAIGKQSSFINHDAVGKTGNFSNVCQAVKTHGSWSGEVRNKRKNGSLFPSLFSANTVFDDNQNPTNYIAIFNDISELKESEQKLEFLAHHDALTTLPNRILLQDRITHAIANAKRNKSMLGVCFIDLDNFKKVNDTFGHTYGDDILKQCSQRIKEQIREVDTLSRIGGDEFILLLENIKCTEEVEHIINKIKTTLEDQFISNNEKFILSASIGIAFYPPGGCSSDELIKNADIAMYKAKEAGKNTYKIFTPDMAEATHKSLDMENDLIEAIKNIQFVVYYQPQINLKTKEVIGLEALIRWNHPVRGILSPLEFIKASEDSKMIIQIGKHVLEKSCEDLIYLQENMNYKGSISVNVSGIQVEHSNFLETLKNTLQESKINPKKLELEITESVVMRDPQQWINLLKSIRRLGVQIAIDDFGTGYSSLSYLRKLPIDKLKVDMSFVRYIPKEEDACAIVNSIINLAENMKMTTIAEGIENIEQEKYLRTNHCEEGQGYLYAKPMPLEDLKVWLKNR